MSDDHDVHWRHYSAGGEQSAVAVGDGAVGEASFDISDDQRSASFDISAQRTQVEAIAEESMDVSVLEEAAVPDTLLYTLYHCIKETFI